MPHRVITAVITAVVTGASCVALSSVAGTAHAATQPADLGNVANVDRGASAPGPHCHFVLPADGNGGFDRIISGAAHEGHVNSGLSGAVFAATACP